MAPDIPPEQVPDKYRAEIDLTGYDYEELDPPDWITDLDREILALLGNSRLVITPAIIAKNIDRSRSSVSRRLNTLGAGGMVEKVERGHYKITEEGLARMYREVPVEAPPERDDDENWRTYRIPTPKDLEEIEENGYVPFSSGP
jgi:DNA-binding transcriptional ArsR family regulator